MKKKILFVAAVVVCIAIAAAGTLAYFTSRTTAHNVITSGKIEINLVEYTLDADGSTQPWDDLTGVMPGETVSKIPHVENIGSEAWIRVIPVVSVYLADGTRVEGNTFTLGGETHDVIQIDLNTSDWTKGADGYYYYNTAVATGSKTTDVFTTVTINPLLPNEFQNCRIEIDIAAEAVQTANNGETALEADGWPEA